MFHALFHKTVLSLGAVGAAFFIAPSTRAFNYVMGDALDPYSTQAQPAKNQSYVDGTYNVTVTRVTNIAQDNPAIPTGPGKGGVGTGYSTWNPLSSDRSKLLLYGIYSVSAVDAYGYQLYNANTHQLIADLSAAGGHTQALEWWDGNDPEPRWDRSGNHPTWLYYRQDMQLRYLDVSNYTNGLIHDFSVDFPSYPASAGWFILSHEYGSPSKDSRYFAYYIENVNNTSEQPLMFVYDQVLNKVISTKIFPANFNGVQGVAMSPSGNYVQVNYWYVPGPASEFNGGHVYSRDFSQYFLDIADNPSHNMFATDNQGHEVVVGLGDNAIWMTRADTGQQYDIYPQQDLGWCGSNLLFTYQSNPGWMFISNCSSTSCQTSNWDDNQIFALELDEGKYYDTSPPNVVYSGLFPSTSSNPPRIWRVSFTQNFIEDGSDGSGNDWHYYQQPNAQMDYEGTTIWWGANWRNINGTSDVYEIVLPPTWVSDLNNTPVVGTTIKVSASNSTRGKTREQAR